MTHLRNPSHVHTLCVLLLKNAFSRTGVEWQPVGAMARKGGLKPPVREMGMSKAPSNYLRAPVGKILDPDPLWKIFDLQNESHS
jgi:hypothetical protein